MAVTLSKLADEGAVVDMAGEAGDPSRPEDSAVHDEDLLTPILVGQAKSKDCPSERCGDMTYSFPHGDDAFRSLRDDHCIEFRNLGMKVGLEKLRGSRGCGARLPKSPNVDEACLLVMATTSACSWTGFQTFEAGPLGTDMLCQGPVPKLLLRT